jgi:hypothetical protein
MGSLKEIVIFIVGTETCSILSLFLIGMLGILPFTTFSITWTLPLIIIAIIINGIITPGLVVWALHLT